ncbi:MAG: PA2169 family four-helix-bundle protein [Chitinophagaceae bacterium]|nr:PA2169 family four-helix-bundle protein [Chitinophagaceae bacterium]MCW5928270.1 PA2169 family four-helix-bundle protein [Chitinophagaceae bacterium]
MDHKACIDALNDLVKINNDRIAGYQKAIEELNDEENNDLKSLFSRMITESKACKEELEQMIHSYGGNSDTGTTASGKLYRAWMDVKAFFGGGDRATILKNCEAGEDAAQKAYETALEDDSVMAETKILIRKQKEQLRHSHDEIKQLRDAAVAQ